MADHFPDWMIEHKEEVIEIVRQRLMERDQEKLNKWRAWSEKQERPITVGQLIERVQPTLLGREVTVQSTIGRHADHTEITFDRTELWHDFNEINADQAFGSFFEHSIPNADHLTGAWLALATETTIRLEKDLNGFFIEAIRPLLHHSLECSRVLLKEATNNPHVHTLQFPNTWPFAMHPLSYYENHPTHVKFPNFPIYVPRRSLEYLKPNRDTVFVTGETAQTATFRPACFDDKETIAAHGSTHLAKLAMYCREYTNSCLAFTCTYQSVTVFRFFIVATADGRERLGVQHRSFAWRPALRGQMSAAKAIMALVLMSLSPEARKFQSREDLGPLASWPRR